MEYQGFFAPLLAHYPLLLYPGIFLSIIIVGNAVSFATLWLAFSENFRASHLFGLIILIFAADVTGDLCWYWLGRGLRDTRPGNFLLNRIPKRKKVEAHLQKHAEKWIFLSKFIPASTFTIIFTTGWAKIKFKKFWPISLAAIASSIFVLMVITYLLATLLTGLEAASVFKHIERLLAIAVIIYIALDYGIAKISNYFIRKSENGQLEQ